MIRLIKTNWVRWAALAIFVGGVICLAVGLLDFNHDFTNAGH